MIQPIKYLSFSQIGRSRHLLYMQLTSSNHIKNKLICTFCVYFFILQLCASVQLQLHLQLCNVFSKKLCGQVFDISNNQNECFSEVLVKFLCFLHIWKKQWSWTFCSLCIIASLMLKDFVMNRRCHLLYLRRDGEKDPRFYIFHVYLLPWDGIYSSTEHNSAFLFFSFSRYWFLLLM